MPKRQQHTTKNPLSKAKVYAVFKEAYPEGKTMANPSKLIIQTMVFSLLKRVMHRATLFARADKKKIVATRHVLAALLSEFPSQVAQGAIEAGNSAVEAYKSSLE